MANEVQKGVIMEADYPNRNVDKKLTILDMKVWLDQDYFIVYQHYQKPVALRQVLSARSAQSTTCKRSVHVREVVRRIINTSQLLDWETYVAPVLKDYIVRMICSQLKSC